MQSIHSPIPPNHSETTTLIECPKCHKHTVVQHGDSVYVCLNCDFRKDVAELPDKNGKPMEFNPFFAILIAVMILLML